MNATYTKLSNGDWGVRIQIVRSEHTPSHPVQVGQTIKVTKKSGETKEEKITAIVWSDANVYLCSIGSSSTRPRRERSRSKHTSGFRPLTAEQYLDEVAMDPEVEAIAMDPSIRGRRS